MIYDTIHIVYSVLKLFTGFASAAFIAWKLIVIKAINKAAAVVITNTVQLIGIRYAKSCSHLCITNQAIGEATKIETAISFKKSLESKLTMLVTLAPSTFLTPISLKRCSALNVARPNKPRHEMKMAMIVKYPTIADKRFSAS